MFKILQVIIILFLLNINISYSQTETQLDFNNREYKLLIPSKPERGKVSTEGFKCKDFNYKVSNQYFVDENSNPYLTEEETSKMIEIGIRSNQITTLINGNDTNKYALRYFLPRVRNIIDTIWHDSIVFKDDKINYGHLSKHQIYDLISSDAVVLGEVTDKLFISDVTKCYLYKTDYIVKVNEVLHSYFELNNGDSVLLKSTLGFEGGCNLENRDLVGIESHGNTYQIGDKWIFFLKHNSYYTDFLYNGKINLPKYDDVYCPHAFMMYNGNHL